MIPLETIAGDDGGQRASEKMNKRRGDLATRQGSGKVVVVVVVWKLGVKLLGIVQGADQSKMRSAKSWDSL